MSTGRSHLDAIGTVRQAPRQWGGDRTARRTLTSIEEPQGLAVTVVLSTNQLDALAHRLALLLSEEGDNGFLDVPGAARYLSTSPKSIYHLTERGQLPHHRAGGRLLFDPAKLRAWVETRTP